MSRSLLLIAGPSGSGKSRLTRLAAEAASALPLSLDDFYHDMNRWSFNLQVYFLNKRFKEVVKIAQSDEWGQ